MSGFNSVRADQDRRGQPKDQTYIDNKRIMFKVIFPLAEIIVDFFDDLKSNTSGYARQVISNHLKYCLKFWRIFFFGF